MRVSKRLGTLMYWVTWPGIRFMLRMSKRTRVAIISGNTILVVRPWLGNGKWSLPGGGVRAQEGERTAVTREVFEETGLELNKNGLKKLKQLSYYQDGLQFDYTLFSYSLQKQAVTTRHTPEITDVAWLEIAMLNKNNANHDVLMALKNINVN